jgi:hypothetical protein
MKITSRDRRLTHRLSLRTPLRVKIWKSEAPERRVESVNLSQTGVLFATDSPIREGETVEIFLNMPEELMDEPQTNGVARGMSCEWGGWTRQRERWELVCSLTVMRLRGPK